MASDIKKKLKGYRYLDQTSRDVQALLENFKNLKVRDSKPFVHSNGAKENCVSVSGTIPVTIRGSLYNIPVTLWLRPNHPYHAPMVYVSPTGAMGIQPSQFVDSNGIVYMPYISEWKHGSSDLSTLTQVMCATFAENCPVYSKTTSAPQPWSPPNRPTVQPPTSYSSPSNYRPPYQQPRYPSGQPAYQRPPVSSPGYPTGGPNPGYPTGGPGAMPTPYGGPTGGYPGYPPTSSNTAQPPYPQGPGQHGGYQPRGPGPATAVGAGMVAAAANQRTAEQERLAQEEHEKIKRQSLETAVEDKIRRQVKQVLDEAQREMDFMLETQDKLKKGNEDITKMMTDMGDKKREVEESIDMLKNKKAELMSLLDYLRAQPDTVAVDEAVTAANPLYNQILRLYAEENAIDDTIYYLGEALRKGVIDLDAFLKHVRELSRQQFMARATIMKARTTAGLPSHGIPA